MREERSGWRLVGEHSVPGNASAERPQSDIRLEVSASFTNR
jgi:hypothetical protein